MTEAETDKADIPDDITRFIAKETSIWETLSPA